MRGKPGSHRSLPVYVGRRYRNNKTGNIYVVCGFSQCSETLGIRVLYEREDGTETEVGFREWDRPVEIFEENFTLEED